MALTLLHEFSTKTTVDGAEIQDEFENVATKFNGGITDSDVNASANIALSKLAGRYQYTTIDLYKGSLTATGPSQVVVLAGVTGDAEWAVDNISWACFDVGNKDAVVDVEWGDYDASGNFVAATTFGPYSVTHAGSTGIAGTGIFLSGGSTSLAYGASVPRVLRFNVTTAVTGTVESTLNVSVTLRRDIQAA